MKYLISIILVFGFISPAVAHDDYWHHHHHHRSHNSVTVWMYSSPPRPVYIIPPPVYVTPVVVIECRQFNGDAILDNNGNRFFGRACLHNDGKWHIQ